MKIQASLWLFILVLTFKCFADCPSTVAIQDKAYVTDHWQPVLPIIEKRNRLHVRRIDRGSSPIAYLC